MRLGIREIYEAARAAGFTPDQATTWTAIALAESGGETGAHNPNGEDSRGLWQINIAPNVRKNIWGDLNDPAVNARAAYDISNHGLDMRPWTTTHASNAGTAADYRTYLDDVSAVTGYTGDPRGVEGYGSPLPEPLPPSGPDDAVPMSYDAIDVGMQPGGNVDTDRDGLTDAFEILTGSRADVADSDSDSLSDAYEATVSHTSAMLADSDSDTLSDSAEEALGTSATAFDSDEDGPSDGLEVRFGSDPLQTQKNLDPALAAAAAAATEPAVEGAVPTAGTTAMGTMTTAPGATPATTGDAANSKADAFVEAALAQKGDSYVFGAEAGLDDADPNTFDCSELTQWAADQVGVTIPDGAMYQYLELKGKGQLMDVDEALNTKGALLFYFSSEPTANGGRPSVAHVAISLGDGQTIEARGTSYGVNEFGGEGRFNYAGVIPGMGDAAPTMTSYDQIDTGTAPAAVGDSDSDGLADAFEQAYGLDPLSEDSDQDGRADGVELIQRTDPKVADDAAVATTASLDGLEPAGDDDSDGLSNAFEVQHGLDPRLADTDQDELSDAAEIALGTNPLAIDSDLDGITDHAEVKFGTDPLDAEPADPALSGFDSGDGSDLA